LPHRADAETFSSMSPRAVIVSWGVVSPLGSGRTPFAEALRTGASAIRPAEFDGLGPLPVAAVAGFDAVPGLDRTVQFLDAAADQMADEAGALSEIVAPERRAVCASTSKGAMLLFLREPAQAVRHFLRLPACDPAWHLARRFRAAGPVQAYAGACATGLTNILRAVDHIESGACDMAVAGSSEATLHPFYLASFLSLGALAKGRSVPFDVCHQGFVAGEGAALFLIAEERAAARAGLRPIARIAGGAHGSDAYHPVGIDVSGTSIKSTGNSALERAGWQAGELDFISAHGTGTQANDTAEAAALRRLLGDAAIKVPVHAYKAASGHLMGAAGAVELAAVLAAMEGGFIPPTVGFATPAPECEGIRVSTTTEVRPVNRVLKWSFGFGGHLVAAAVERV